MAWIKDKEGDLINTDQLFSIEVLSKMENETNVFYVTGFKAQLSPNGGRMAAMLRGPFATEQAAKGALLDVRREISS